ncbi:MAG: hypothetical protein L0G10_16230 [Acinetobacter sp.]|nr:hypothetical protein [Acinetobacter sp.]
MPNSKNSIIKNYDAGDMHDLASLSEADLKWSFTAINLLSKKITELKKTLEQSYKVPDYYFEDLETLSGMFEYLANDRHEYHFDEANKYLEELEAVKGGNK